MKDTKDNFREQSEQSILEDSISNEEGRKQKNEGEEKSAESQTTVEQINEENRTCMEEAEALDRTETEADEQGVKETPEERQATEEGNEEVHEAVQEDQVHQETEEAVLTEEAERCAESGGSQQYSCSYQPPYYVPNVTVGSEAPKEERKKCKKRSIGAAVIALVLVLTILISFLGGVAGYFGSDWLYKLLSISSALGSTSDDDANGMTVIKNDGSITVNEETNSSQGDEMDVVGVVAHVADSVVEISTTHVQTDPFYGNYVTSGAGSGVIIDQEGTGYIITNHHVIEGASEITVRLTDGTEYVATSLGSDADHDIAVLKINASGLTPAVLGSSANLEVGEAVVAIGNPLGSLGGTVTDGIISALDRNLIIDGHLMTLLQTNAAINPGNSGGGLFDMHGNLIGIVNAKSSDTGIEGLGFAIPIDIAWAVAKDIIEYGYVTGKLVLGFEVKGHSDDFSVSQGFFNYTMPAGVYVSESENSELQTYDRITEINGTEITGIASYYNAILRLKDGDRVTVTVSRLVANGMSYSFQTHTVTLIAKETKAPNA